jgi:hypothetical protein
MCSTNFGQLLCQPYLLYSHFILTLSPLYCFCSKKEGSKKLSQNKLYKYHYPICNHDVWLSDKYLNKIMLMSLQTEYYTRFWWYHGMKPEYYIWNLENFYANVTKMKWSKCYKNSFKGKNIYFFYDTMYILINCISSLKVIPIYWVQDANISSIVSTPHSNINSISTKYSPIF